MEINQNPQPIRNQAHESHNENLLIFISYYLSMIYWSQRADLNRWPADYEFHVKY
jgi:hypothetical protein